MTTTIFKVPEISCEHCKSTIEAAIGDLDDVDAVVVDIDAKSVTVDGGDPSVIVSAIEEAGYDIAT